MIKKLFQVLLGIFLTSAGSSHLDSNRTEFLAQVPTWLPLDADFVVVASGLVEITLGVLLITTVLVFKKGMKKLFRYLLWLQKEKINAMVYCQRGF